jgi:hypothetical protein
MMRLPTLAAVVLSLVAATACAGVHEDMVALDRAYVPALALTNQPKPEPSRKAMARLREEWNRFKGAHAQAPAGYEPAAWTRASADIEAAIAAAEKSLDAGKPGAAHEDLERVREVQLTLRRGAKQPYFLDDLTVYHEAMEKLAGPAAAKTATTITEADIAAIKAAMPEAERAWAIVVTNQGAASKHGLSAEAEAQVQRDIDAETRVMADLKAALDAGDRGRIAETAMATKPAFSRLFQRFGQFDGLR